jgi:5-formyltetrahydrofolate cyclo-ligase
VPARHDVDAGGDPELLTAKAALRERVWADLDRPGVARFPKPANRIPNFVGAEAAARRLAETDEWVAASTVKSNPDSPQWPVRQRALEDGKVVYMAVPRLAERDPFFLLDPDHLADARARPARSRARAAARAPWASTSSNPWTSW